MTQNFTKRGDISHVIFDMDGVLLDTEKLYSVVYSEIVAKYGKTYDWTIKPKLMGMKALKAAKILIAELDLPVQPEHFIQLAEDGQKLMFPNCELLPGADKLVRHLHNNDIPIAVSTGSSIRSFDLKTQLKHKQFFSLFHHIVCCGSDPEVKHGKPAPDAYTVAAQRFEGGTPKPTNVLVFEDAPNGIKSGLAAGMNTVFVPDKNLDQSFYVDGAHQILESLEDFVPEEWGLPAYDRQCIV
ncbi:uncharacterized protein LOC144442168 [Glandiceps talaboti]